MFESQESQRAVGRYAWAMAWVGLVMGQLHALARHNTADGKGDLQLPLTRLWSDPARKALKPLLDWADPDTVYLSYGKIWLFVFAAFAACALVVYRRRQPAGFEKWAWRAALGSYGLIILAVFGDYYTQWTSYTTAGEISFVALTIPGLLLTMLSSTVLGITLLAKRFRPLTPALLLALVVPLAFGILSITSMGNAALPILFGFGLLGRRIARDEPVAAAPRRGTAQNDTVQNDTVGGVSWPAGAS